MYLSLGQGALRSIPRLLLPYTPHTALAHHLALRRSARRAELVERVGGLEAEAEWSHVLSLGEQQRVAFLRLLLHAPKLAFLDEATGALDSATEAALYTRLRSYCTSYISVGGWPAAAALLQDTQCFTDMPTGIWAWHHAMSA